MFKVISIPMVVRRNSDWNDGTMECWNILKNNGQREPYTNKSKNAQHKVINPRQFRPEN
jgi:hypothetical protein